MNRQLSFAQAAHLHGSADICCVVFCIINNISSWTVIGPLFVAPAVGVAMAMIYLKTQRSTWTRLNPARRELWQPG